MTHQKHQDPEVEEPGEERIENQEPTPVDEEVTETDWEEKSNEYLNDLKRLQAEFENYKRRQAANQKELGGYLIEKLVLDIVPVLDNFRAATEHVPEEAKDSPWVTGIQYIEKQLEKVLIDNGVTPIEAKEGDEFDPRLHEAVGAVGTEGSEPVEERSVEGEVKEVENSVHFIVKVVQKGYRLGEKVIRPARVIVK